MPLCHAGAHVANGRSPALKNIRFFFWGDGVRDEGWGYGLEEEPANQLSDVANLGMARLGHRFGELS